MEEGLDALLRRRKAGQLLVLDEVVGKRVAESVDVAGVEQLVHAPHRGCVIHRSLSGRVLGGSII